MLDTLHTKLRRATSIIVVFTLTAVAPLLGADSCVSVGNNLMIPNNCGFDSGTTTSWTALSGVGALSTSSAGLASPTGNPYMVITPTSAGLYNIRSANFNLVAGANYLVTFSAKANSGNTSIGLVNIIGAGSINLLSNAPVTDSAWTSYSFVVTALNSGAYQFAISSTSTSNQTIFVDGFVVVQVPEPTSMLLLGSLCSAVVAYRKRARMV